MKNQKIIPYGNIPDIHNLGQLIREHRKQQGLTQTKLSMFSGVSPKFISELENGKATAEIGKTLRVLQYLGLEMKITPRGFEV